MSDLDLETNRQKLARILGRPETAPWDELFVCAAAQRSRLEASRTELEGLRRYAATISGLNENKQLQAQVALKEIRELALKALKEGGDMADFLRAQTRKGIEHERECCAEVADRYASQYGGPVPKAIAAAIRARGKP